MKIIIDIGHPAHIHCFKHTAIIMTNLGNEVLFTARDKEVTLSLLKHYGFNYYNLGKPFRQRYKKIKGLLLFGYKLLKIALKFKPDVYLSAGSIYASHVAFLTNKPHITLEDTGNDEQVKLYLPFTKFVLTSTYFQEDYGLKQIRYPGFHELAYLHPNYFKPDSTIKSILGVDENNKIVILRFVAWSATHDNNIKGLSMPDKFEIVNTLSKYAKVFISSESELPESLKQYQLKTNPELIHQVLANADLLFGESGTMTSECSVLGTPAIQISGLPKNSMGVLAKQEEYGLVHVFEKYDNNVLNLAISLLSDNEIKMKLHELRNKMLKENIDLTEFLVDFVSDRINQKFPVQTGAINFNKYIHEQ